MLALVTIGIASLALLGGSASAQSSIASSLDVYVFPSQGQEPTKQSQDESECYQWAVKNTGTDPFELQKQVQAAQQQGQTQQQATAQATQGAGVRSAARGAAAGALIGEIASDDPGQGAAWGAAAGAVRGRRRSARAEQQSQQQAEQQVAQAQQLSSEQMAKFKNALSVCLEAKGYMVKY
jgi:hypothetical protein